MNLQNKRPKLKRLVIILIPVILVMWAAVKMIWFKPFTIDILYERAMLKYAFLDPETMSGIGLLDGIGLDFYNDDLTDPSYKAAMQRLSLLEGELKVLRSFRRDTQTREQLLSTDILEWYLEDCLEAGKFNKNGYPVNHFLGVQKSLPKFMCNTHAIHNIGDARDYISRLKGFEKHFDAILKTLREREAFGVLPPKFVVLETIADMRGFIKPSPGSNILYENLKARLDAIKASPEDKKALLKDAERAMVEKVYPAYQKLIDYYREILPKTQETVGVWHQTNGDDYYAYMVKSQTTLDISPEELYRKLEKEVGRLQAELAGARKGNVTVTGSIGSLEACQKVVDDMTGKLGSIVNRLPKNKVVVQFSVTQGAADDGMCQYFPSDIHGRTPAIINVPRSFVNYDTYTAKWLLYHEGVPGHHLQFAIARELENVPTFRKILPFAAFTEGWATYAQDLPFTMGLTSDPNQLEGIIRNRLFHMGRAMLDIGINYKRWTREEAVEFAITHEVSNYNGANALVDYCTVYPGSELSYAVGCLKIEELRDLAAAKLGEAFDIREFHDEVLKNGAIPLDVLDDEIKVYIAHKKSVQP